MPTYKVKKDQKGFFDGQLYDANGKRPHLTVAEAFKDAELPSWVEPLEEVKEVVSKGRKTKADPVVFDETPATDSNVETL